jgi:hypothetical protein
LNKEWLNMPVGSGRHGISSDIGIYLKIEPPVIAALDAIG